MRKVTYELKARSGGDICVLGGSDFARSLLAAGVIDEVGCNVHPVLLGRHLRGFEGRRDNAE